MARHRLFSLNAVTLSQMQPAQVSQPSHSKLPRTSLLWRILLGPKETVRQQETLGQYTERMALRLAVPAGLLLFIVILLANRNRNPVPMVGDWQAFGRLFVIWIIPLSLITGAFGYILGIRAWNERVAPHRQRDWRWGVLPIALAYSILLSAMAMAAVRVAAAGFQQLYLDKFQGALLAGAVGAALLFWMVKQVMNITVNKLLQTTIILITGGVYLTMMAIDDPLWWQQSFSHLGTLESNTSTIFNSTLVFSGILFLVWLPYLMADLQVLVRHGYTSEYNATLFKAAFIVLSIGIMVVGLVQYGVTPLSSFTHNAAAYTIAAMLILLMLGIRWLVPRLPREVFVTSWLLVGAVIAALIAAALGYFNTVGLELILFTLGMVWLQFFVRNVQTHAIELEPDAYPA
jgi:hypothetical protein